MTISTVQAAMSGVPIDLLTALTTGTGTPIALPPSFRHHTIIIQGASGVSAGAVQIETANDPNYSGTWAQIGGGPIIVVGGADVEYSWEGIFNFIRARVTTTISGGGSPSTTVTYEGAKSY